MTVLLVCACLEASLLGADYFVNFSRGTDVGALRRLTNIAREDGLASWFATTQTLLVGLTAWFFWLCTRARGIGGWRRRVWLLTAVLFSYMALDDGVQLHERVGTALSAGEVGALGFPSFAWQPLFAPALGGALLLVAGLLWREVSTRAARVAILGAVGLFGLALALDFMEGLPVAHPMNWYTELVLRVDLADFTQTRFGLRPYDAVLHASRAIEETAEMLANTLLWAVLLSQAERVVGTLELRSRNRLGPPATGARQAA